MYNNQKVNTKYIIKNVSSLQKLQNLSKQVASILEQIQQVQQAQEVEAKKDPFNQPPYSTNEDY